MTETTHTHTPLDSINQLLNECRDLQVHLDHVVLKLREDSSIRHPYRKDDQLEAVAAIASLWFSAEQTVRAQTPVYLAEWQREVADGKAKINRITPGQCLRALKALEAALVSVGKELR